ncbi:TPA: 50S ribosomal protein L7/L12 [Candidatus Poribacteria bacterium]|jgi:large subunit ribosomal protein L7/L12|nr:50S ribosomal protein L7/L12 [Candidatus Poribacteria bacterium]HIA70374.1 50S ribosomal protein L7/L12 [Candidatus Poribacteria bacterium]HIB87497.1 50S ribosomal protein L7/L12 [Candidatus Poribacteria bacterium]HIB98660.1 50S ribosomal protein L7/L12 [Candidatus Poribacteria bacterium]HIC18012.1 50S ribosomal protein L7/L12 [Candidatus Poribacteria bacterium]
MADIEKLIDEIGNMTVLELSELVKSLEEKFDVSAAAPVMAAGMMPAVAAEGEAEETVVEEKTSFDVQLKEMGDQKIKVIKEVRAITGLGLKEAKAAVEEAPTVVKEGVSQEEADEVKEKLEAVGAVVEIL